jgi:hypothetical protein
VAVGPAGYSLVQKNESEQGHRRAGLSTTGRTRLRYPCVDLLRVEASGSHERSQRDHGGTNVADSENCVVNDMVGGDFEGDVSYPLPLGVQFGRDAHMRSLVGNVDCRHGCAAHKGCAQDYIEITNQKVEQVCCPDSLVHHSLCRLLLDRAFRQSPRLCRGL